MGQASVSELANALTSLETAVNVMWVVTCCFLIMLMQAGFALVETGLTRRKNAAHTMGMNFLVYAIGALGYWAAGFALQMGGMGDSSMLGGITGLDREVSIIVGGQRHGLLGAEGFLLPARLLTPGVATLFMFQMMFMDTAATIPTGALAERWRFASFLLFSVCVSTVIYPVYGNWVWGGGVLASLGRTFGLGHGHVDFAGSSVVHLTGGVIAAVCAKMLGPRTGKFGPNGEVHAIVGHDTPMVVLGTFILAFGWFGFNAGSTLAATDTRTAVIAVNTLLAGSAGALAACLFTWWRFGKPDVSMICNGMLAGLVAITASCAFVAPVSAVAIGGVGGTLVVASTLFVEHKLRIDDPVGAISVHGVNGAWGIVALGLFADGSYGNGWNGVDGPVRGLLFGDTGQLYAGLIGIGANVVFVGTASAFFFALVGSLVGNRVTPADEALGLDLAEMGMEGYPSDENAPGAYASMPPPTFVAHTGVAPLHR
jgi:ammonium transporter, Amt family